MSRNFGGATSDRVSYSGAHVGDGAGTICLWLKCNDSTNRTIFWGDSVTTRLFAHRGNDATKNITFSITRATADCWIQAAAANWANWATGKWVFVAIIFDTGGVNGDQKLYIGDRTAVPAEPSAYNNHQDVGSGAVTSDTGSNLFIGNWSLANSARDCDIGWVGVWRGRRLSAGEIFDQWLRPHVTANQELFAFPGQSTEADWSGGGHAGTSTGTSITAPPPIGNWFGGDSALRYAVAAAGGGGGGHVFRQGDLDGMGGVGQGRFYPTL